MCLATLRQIKDVYGFHGNCLNLLSFAKSEEIISESVTLFVVLLFPKKTSCFSCFARFPSFVRPLWYVDRMCMNVELCSSCCCENTMHLVSDTTG